jgi:hypothetical protein
VQSSLFLGKNFEEKIWHLKMSLGIRDGNQRLHGQCRVLVLAKFTPFFGIGQKKLSYLVELSLLRKVLYGSNSFQCRLDPLKDRQSLSFFTWLSNHSSAHNFCSRDSNDLKFWGNQFLSFSHLYLKFYDLCMTNHESFHTNSSALQLDHFRSLWKSSLVDRLYDDFVWKLIMKVMQRS